jgi:hypothetical protein
MSLPNSARCTTKSSDVNSVVVAHSSSKKSTTTTLGRRSASQRPASSVRKGDRV